MCLWVKPILITVIELQKYEITITLQLTLLTISLKINLKAWADSRMLWSQVNSLDANIWCAMTYVGITCKGNRIWKSSFQFSELWLLINVSLTHCWRIFVNILILYGHVWRVCTKSKRHFYAAVSRRRG